MPNLGPAGGHDIAEDYSFVGQIYNNMATQNLSTIWRNVILDKIFDFQIVV